MTALSGVFKLKTPEGAVIGLAAPWNALPRPVRVTDMGQAVYPTPVRSFITGHGLKNPEVEITQILRVDLDGDGENEMLISATNYSSEDGSAPTSGAERRLLVRPVATRARGGSRNETCGRRILSVREYIRYALVDRIPPFWI